MDTKELIIIGTGLLYLVCSWGFRPEGRTLGKKIFSTVNIVLATIGVMTIAMIITGY